MAFITTAEEFGLKKGLKQGRKEGKKEGKEEGRKDGEKEKALAIAKNMLAKGFEPELIEEITGLSGEEIVALMH